MVATLEDDVYVDAVSVSIAEADDVQVVAIL